MAQAPTRFKSSPMPTPAQKQEALAAFYRHRSEMLRQDNHIVSQQQADMQRLQTRPPGIIEYIINALGGNPQGK